MTTDIASLGLAIDTKQVVKAEGDLDSLTAAGGRAESSAKRMGDAWSKTAQAIQADTGRIVQQLQAMNAAQARQESLLSQLNGTMQAVERAVQGLTAAQIESTRAVQGQAAATASETAAAQANATAQIRQAAAAEAAAKAASQAAQAQAKQEAETQKAARAAALAEQAQAKQAAEADKLARETLKVEQANRKAAEAAEAQRRKMEEQRQSAGALDGAMLALAKATAIAFAVKKVVDFTMALYEASAAGQRLRTTLDFASGGSGGRELAYVTKVANDLGLQLSSTAKAYASFTAATKGTTLEGQKTRDIFESISKASAVMGLSADQSAGALLALQQMASKGTVASEELRGQLGERLPGAFQIAAKAMGVTTAQLGKMLEHGQVVADDFLPKFAKALNEHIGTAAEQAANRLDASTNRMQTAWERMQRNVGDSGVAEYMASRFRALTDGMDNVSESMEAAKSTGGGFASQMLAASGALLEFANPVKAFTGATLSMSGQLREAQTEVERLTKLQASLKNGIESGIYGPNMQRDLDETNRKLIEAAGRFRAVDAAMRNLAGTGAGAGRGMVNPATIANMEAERKAVEAGVKAYTDASGRMTKAQQREKEVTDANKAAQVLLNDARLTGAQRIAVEAAKTTELANINEKYRDKGAAAGAKAQQNAYESLLASINTKIAAEKEELAVGRQLSESEKFAVKLNEEIAAGKAKITAAARAEIEARIAELAKIEETARAKEREKVLDEQRAEGQRELAKAREEESKAREAGDLAISEYLLAGREAQELAEAEIANLGRTASERAVANEQLRIEIERRKQIDAIGKNKGYDDAQRTAAEATVNGVAGGAKERAQAIEDMKLLNELMDPDKAESFGDALKGAFEGAMQPLVRAGQSLEKYSKDMARIDKQREAAKRTIKDQTKLQDALSRADQEEGKAKLDMFATLADAASGYFDKESKGHKALQAVNQAIRVAEMAGSMASLATTGSVETAKQSMYSITALAAALAGPWPGNIVAFAQVAGMLAGIGVAVSGGGGGGEGGGYEGIKPGGTGGVLGAEGDPSKSIGNAIEMLADNSRIELTVSQRMLSELTKVREGIQGLAGDISKDFFIRGMAGGSFGDDFLDSGVGFLPGQNVGSIIKDGINGFGFNLIFANGAQAMWRELDPAFKRSISSVLGNIVDTVISAADMLGLADGGLIDRMLSIIPVLGDTSTYAMNGITAQGGGLLSFKDKSGKEIQEELEAVFSSVGDQMVAQALPALAAYQRVGEGMFETLIRVTSGIERAEYALERYGIAAVNYADVIRKDGDLATEIIRQSVMALEPVGSGVAKILRDFTGEFQDLLDTYDQLVGIRGLLRDIGADDMALGTGQVRGAGGIDSLQSGIETFRDSFFTEQEQVDAAWARMTEQFAILGTTMPRTNEEFRRLALGIDQSTEEGAQLFGRLMTLAEGFAEVTGRTDDLAAAALDAAEALADAAQQAAEAADEARRAAAAAATTQAQNAFSLLQRSVAARKNELKEQYDAEMAAARAEAEAAAKARAEQNRMAQQRAQDALASIRSIFSALQGAMQGAVIESQELTKQRRQAALALVGSAAGRRNGYNTPGLEDALQALQEPSESLYASFEEYAIDQAEAAAAIAKLEASAGAQISTQEAILAALQRSAEAAARVDTTITDALTEQYEADIEALDALLAEGQLHLNVLQGIDTSVVSVEAAVERTRTAIVTAYDAQMRVSVETTAALWALHRAVIGTGIDGSHAMGLASVPWDGYRAELHAGERVLTKEDNEIFSRGDWLRGGSGDNRRVEMLLEQILDNDRGTRKDMNNGNREVISNTRVAASVALRNEVANQPVVPA